jgi:hypothetical protein
MGSEFVGAGPVGDLLILCLNRLSIDENMIVNKLSIDLKTKQKHSPQKIFVKVLKFHFL